MYRIETNIYIIGNAKEELIETLERYEPEFKRLHNKYKL